jgi:murein DD-endopeptidase MepM/ murein hydrolase activator NlpD
MRAAALLVGLCLAIPAFGAPRAESVCSTGMVMPPETLREISRGFSGGHSGIDLMAPYGSPIRAAAGGTVMYAGWYYAYGNIVDIRHTDGLITRYAHMSAFAPGIAPGAPVAGGAVIGQVGMTGRAHGPHVHFEVRVEGHAVDPRPYLALAPCRRPLSEPLEVANAPEVGRHDR